ncbi:putative protein phosphatase 2C 1, partial [Bienertia sinuspersici]
MGFCGQKRSKRTFSDHVATLQHLSPIPNRFFMNRKNRSSCIFTHQGRKGIYQDVMIVWKLILKSFVSHDFTVDDATFCGVFDGHMPHGDLVARRVRDALPLKLLSFLNSCQTKEVVPSGAGCNGDLKCDDSEVDKILRSHPNLDCFCSWSTAVTIVKQGSNLFMGNIGDSRAIMGSKDSNDSFVVIQLTVDLKPDLPREAERIKRCKGRVFALQDELEVPKVRVPFDDAPGTLTHRDQFIVMASD